IKMLIVDFYHIPIAVSLGVVFGILDRRQLTYIPERLHKT
ncbi:hypothetical protein O5269_27500, partial [Escherichia coli]|nr:hypothetical protein [Escherichia coli]